eukprot:107382_1
MNNLKSLLFVSFEYIFLASIHDLVTIALETNTECSNGFICPISRKCISIDMLCNGEQNCAHNEDESQCTICFSDLFTLFGGSFEYFAYNEITKSIVYKNSINNYYLYHPNTSQWG